MRILHVASECYPLVKTGGLADVVGALPPAQAGLGDDVRLLLPGYPAVLDGLEGLVRTHALPVPWAPPAWLAYGRTPAGVPCYAVEAPALYDRPGNPYLDANGKEWWDNHLRFALLGWAAAWLAGPAGGRRWRPDILHAHDWQAGLAPAYAALSGQPRPGTVTTIHNIAYQGVFPPWVLDAVGIPNHAFSIAGLEYYGQVGYLKAGLWYADRLTTVSPTYAREIRTADGGSGLHGLLAGRASDLQGILNGVDYEVWDPAADPHLPACYDVDDLTGKAACKAALQAELGLAPEPETPLFAVVSRLAGIKGLDLLLEAGPALAGLGAQLAVLGTGDRVLEDGFRALAAAHPGRVAAVIGYDEALSHRIQGGADCVMLPSRSEPCGLVQMFGLRYGALPLVRRVGGLADTVVDAGEVSGGVPPEAGATGFVFEGETADALLAAAGRAVALYRHPGDWARVRRTAMTRDFSWTASARRYRDLYLGLHSDV